MLLSQEVSRCLARRGFVKIYESPQKIYLDFQNMDDPLDYITAAWLDGQWQLDRFTVGRHRRVGYAANMKELRALTEGV